MTRRIHPDDPAAGRRGEFLPFGGLGLDLGETRLACRLLELSPLRIVEGKAFKAPVFVPLKSGFELMTMLSREIRGR